MTDNEARAALAARCEGIGNRNLILGLEQRRADKRVGMAAARHWRESRRCKRCGALAFISCAHRPEGAHGDQPAGPSVEHMPFQNHRTCAELLGLGR